MPDAAPLPPPPAVGGRARTGVEGLDDVLAGGLARGRLYLLEGAPGTGKTTLALQFLLDGARAGERVLYITLSETGEELREGAASHGWDLSGVEVFELSPAEAALGGGGGLGGGDRAQSLLYSADLELGETVAALLAAVERARPARVVLDSLSEVRLLAQGSLRYRRQILALKHAFARAGDATVLLLDDLTADPDDKTAHSLAHGVLRLEELAPDYGPERRRLRVVKYRGTAFRGGHHDFALGTGGVRVFPRLVSSEARGPARRDRLGSGIAGLDALLGGGLERGTSALLLGPAGSGKSLLALAFAVESARRGEPALVCTFDEEPSLLVERAAAVGLDAAGLTADGRLVVEQVDAAEVSPGEFAHRVRERVAGGVRTVVIDSLNGYQLAMPGERYLTLHMHELLQYLNRIGVSTFLTVAQHGLVGDMSTPVDVTYLADTVVLLRFFEARGRVRRAISALKKRAGAHEDTVREFRIQRGGIAVGEPLTGFQGVLRGIPEFVGEAGGLLNGSADAPDGDHGRPGAAAR